MSPPSTPESGAGPTDDPVITRRRQIQRITQWGQRGGYLFYGLAMIAFFAALVAGFSGILVNIAVLALVAGSVLLGPAMVFGYAVKAADREDAGTGDDWR